MRPTPAEELTALNRILTAISRQEGLPAAVTDDLRDAGRTLQRVERSLGTLLPYLCSDNERLAQVLLDLQRRGLAIFEPAEGDLIETAGRELTGDWMADVDKANTHNEQLRAVLSHVLRSTAFRAGDAVAIEVQAALVESLRGRPW